MALSDKPLVLLREAAPTPSAAKTGPPLNPSAAEPAQQSLSLELSPELSSERSSWLGARPVSSPARRLWLCLHFPMLPLQALSDSGAATARAVFEDQKGIPRLLLVNGQAESRGVTPGLSVNAALALLPTLRLEARNPAREEQLLKNLAAWAERFTSVVSIDEPALLLLEIAGSLRLFGGVDRLWQQIETGLGQRGFNVSMAIAPTPLASVWLAKACRNVRLESLENLTGSLSPLPLHCLGWPESVRDSLNGMGLTCIGDCLRLPRQGFARRFGAMRLLQLDRALGRLPDPRASYRAPERFCQDYELTEEQHDSKLLLQACRQLLMALERFLTSRQMAVRQLRFSFFHLRADTTRLTLRRMQTGGVVDHWFELLEIRFDRMTLPAPVIAIRLRGGQGQALQSVTQTLPFDGTTGRQSRVPVAHLMERLSARMGDASVHGVTWVAEHRPQYAWSTAEALGAQVPQCPAAPHRSHECQPQLLADIRRGNSLLLRRPLWMLPEPTILTTEEDNPSYHGPLQLMTGPERLETGWWDGNGIARDYFVAVNPGGVHLWVYRNRGRETGWYLHGIFG